ncbi:MAG: UbiA prenyltransferase family protein [Muribaculaceae bacterium]|nr:UbiA prenyltransferase family protein [Muribaculaceae bacterium]
MRLIKDIIILIRVRQWVKNLFVFLPLIFGGGLMSSSGLLAGAGVFICFCLASSAIYALNDVANRKTDSLHPAKSHRPVASGRIRPEAAGAVSGGLGAAALAGAAWMFPHDMAVCAVIGAYLLLNVLYTYLLKHMAIIDVLTIATGFVLRVYGGGEACGIAISPWLTVMVFLSTLFIAFGKRRDDLMTAQSDNTREPAALRRSVAGYTLGFIDQTMTLLASAMIVAYIIYTLQPEVCERFGSEQVYLTTVFVIAGVLRYMQKAMVKNETGDPSALVTRDPFIIGCVACWLAAFIFIIYIAP